MKKTTLLIAALGLNFILTGHAQTGSTQPPAGSECFEKAAALHTKSPQELWNSIPVCVANGQHEQALFMFGLAGSQGVFDAMRVTDASAHPAAKILPLRGMALMGEEKSGQFQQKIQAHFGDATKRAALCEAYKAMPTPSYVPNYMIQHGMAAMSGTNAPALTANFNAAEAWPQAVDRYMLCPK